MQNKNIKNFESGIKGMRYNSTLVELVFKDHFEEAKNISPMILNFHGL